MPLTGQIFAINYTNFDRFFTSVPKDDKRARLNGPLDYPGRPKKLKWPHNEKVVQKKMSNLPNSWKKKETNTSLCIRSQHPKRATTKKYRPLTSTCMRFQTSSFDFRLKLESTDSCNVEVPENNSGSCIS